MTATCNAIEYITQRYPNNTYDALIDTETERNWKVYN